MGDLLLCPPDLTEGEEVFLADTLGEFADGVGKIACEEWIEIHQGIDTETIDIVFRDQVIEGAHQRLKHEHPLGGLVIGHEGLERIEVARRDDLRINESIALALEKTVPLEFARPHSSIESRI